jgi:hypothetical protein
VTLSNAILLQSKLNRCPPPLTSFGGRDENYACAPANKAANRVALLLHAALLPKAPRASALDFLRLGLCIFFSVAL